MLEQAITEVWHRLFAGRRQKMCKVMLMHGKIMQDTDVNILDSISDLMGNEFWSVLVPMTDILHTCFPFCHFRSIDTKEMYFGVIMDLMEIHLERTSLAFFIY